MSETVKEAETSPIYQEIKERVLALKPLKIEKRLVKGIPEFSVRLKISRVRNSLFHIFGIKHEQVEHDAMVHCFEAKNLLLKTAEEEYPNGRISRLFESINDLHPSQRILPTDRHEVVLKVKVYL